MEEHIRQSNLIEDIDDKEADKQSMKAWMWLKNQKKLDKKTLLKLHKMITKSQLDLEDTHKGQYRNIGVMVGGRVCPSPYLVPELMNNWFLDFKMREPVINHVMFEKVHPFADANGRTGRMVMWWQQKSIGQEPMLIPANEREKYYEWFKGDNYDKNKT